MAVIIMAEMNINGMDGKFVVGGWLVDFLDSGELIELEVFLDQSDLVILNIDYQNGKLTPINRHPTYTEYEIVQASDNCFYAIRFGRDSVFFKNES